MAAFATKQTCYLSGTNQDFHIASTLGAKTNLFFVGLYFENNLSRDQFYQKLYPLSHDGRTLGQWLWSSRTDSRLGSIPSTSNIFFRAFQSNFVWCQCSQKEEWKWRVKFNLSTHLGQQTCLNINRSPVPNKVKKIGASTWETLSNFPKHGKVIEQCMPQQDKNLSAICIE